MDAVKTKELEKVIDVLAKRSQNPINAEAALKYTQAMLNTAHVINILNHKDNN